MYVLYLYYFTQLIADKMEHWLDEHDRLDPSVKHQGMVLTQTKVGINPASVFCDVYNEHHEGNKSFPVKCEVYISESSKEVYERFKRQEICTLVIIGKLLEGFDHKFISVLGMVRNVAPSSRVLFTQFVGRARTEEVTKYDPVTAQLVTHKRFKQYENFQKFETLAEEDPVDED